MSMPEDGGDKKSLKSKNVSKGPSEWEGFIPHAEQVENGILVEYMYHPCFPAQCPHSDKTTCGQWAKRDKVTGKKIEVEVAA